MANRRKLLTRRELAALLRVHPISIAKWQDRGLPVARLGRRGSPSLFSVPAVRRWLAAHKGTRDETAAMRLACARLAAARTRLIEQRCEQTAAALVDRRALEASTRAMFAHCRARILGIAPATRAALPHVSAADVTVIDRLVSEAIEELSIEHVRGLVL